MAKRKNKNKRRNNQNRNNQNQQRRTKRRKFERFWVEDCTELKPPEGQEPDLLVTISRVELHDDHTHKAKTDKIDLKIGASEKGNNKPGENVTGLDAARGSVIRTQIDQDDGVKLVDSTKAEITASTGDSESGKPVEPSSLIDSSIEAQLDQRDGAKPVDSSKTETTQSNDPKSGEPTTAHQSKGDAMPSDAKHDEDLAIDRSFVSVIRAPSAKGPMKKFNHQNFKPLPNGDCGDGVVNPHDKSEVPDKYWAQRKRFFSRFDEGVSLDKEGWYSITPEKIANHIAERVVEGETKGMVVLDAFCGCGGNAIAFAQRQEVSLVVAIDSDRHKLQLAATNASVYGIAKEKLLLIHGNACEALQSYKNGKRETSEKEQGNVDRVEGFQIGGMELLPDRMHAVFLSPPWGGMDYAESGKRNYHVETCIEVQAFPDGTWNGEEILQASAAATSGPVVYFLPRNINGVSLGRSALKSKYKTLEIEQNILNNKLKTVTAYLGMPC